MKKKQLIGLLLFFSTVMGAQNHYNIRLNPTESPQANKFCYHIQLASANGKTLNLAGQNYRIYYDTKSFRYDNNSSSSLLTREKYTPLMLRENLTEIDASGVGNLSFDDHLGFLNIGMDLDDLLDGGIILPSSGEWIRTTQICFDYASADINLTPEDNQLFWARPTLTQAYATAFVEVSEWVAPYNTQPIMGEDYQDISLSTALETSQWQQSITVYPNPTYGKVSIAWASLEALKLKVWGINGATIQEHSIPKGTTSYSFDLGSVPSGTYQLEVLGSNNKRFTKKIEKIQ